MSQSHRLGEGGRIDRQRPLTFTFDGQHYSGFEGDTLASALLANGVKLVGRSFKYHRPRGIYGIGEEEPNALVTLREGGRREPNCRATTAELYDGLLAESQNRWPSLKLDVMALNGLFMPFFSAGFYYKTFMGPTKRAWMFYEHFIRRAAGLGLAQKDEPDPDRYDRRHAFCDVLVVGAGPAGLSAALAAGRAGARVILAEQDAKLGGSLLHNRKGGASDAWLEKLEAELEGMENVTILRRTGAFGVYDGKVVGLCERVSDHLAVPAEGQPRQRFWIVRPARIVAATGAIERPLVFANNDRPGIMSASAVRAYLNRYGVLPGRKVVVFTNNDSAYPVAIDLARAGAEVTLAEARQTIGAEWRKRLADANVEMLPGHVVVSAHGSQAVKSVDLARYEIGQEGRPNVARHLDCDLVCSSGGWTPTLHLLTHAGVKARYDETLACFVPGDLREGLFSAGACQGAFAASEAAAAGFQAGQEAVKGLEAKGKAGDLPALQQDLPDAWEEAIVPLWEVPSAEGGKGGKKFLDPQNDVGTADVALAHQEGYVSVEHLKRYTTLGMATDQGKTSNMNALAIMAGLRSQDIPTVGTTTFRPPYTPVALGLLAGPETGLHFKPVRRSPAHHWHEKNGAVMVETGLWMRPRYYPKAQGQGVESLKEAYIRETRQVRETVGMVDVTTLGKIDVQGPDAAEFLNRVYINGWSKLAVGKARYGIMLREDGMVWDDGTTSRLSENHFFMTTTTANAAPVLAWLERYLQVHWPDLKVQVTSVTEQWAGAAVAGPKAREVLQKVVTGLDLSNEAFPFMGVGEGKIGDVPVRVLRISFSGELAYEVYCPAGFGEEVWETLHESCVTSGGVAYGTETLGALRIEKGHVAGPELDGRTALADLRLEKMASSKKPFVGSVLMKREGMVDPKRPRLCGLIPTDKNAKLRAGAILVNSPEPPKGHGLGHVTSITYSPQLGSEIALGLLSGADERMGDKVYAIFPMWNECVEVTVSSSHFYDPKGERMHV